MAKFVVVFHFCFPIKAIDWLLVDDIKIDYLHLCTIEKWKSNFVLWHTNKFDSHSDIIFPHMMPLNWVEIFFLDAAAPKIGKFNRTISSAKKKQCNFICALECTRILLNVLSRSTIYSDYLFHQLHASKSFISMLLQCNLHSSQESAFSEIIFWNWMRQIHWTVLQCVCVYYFTTSLCTWCSSVNLIDINIIFFFSLLDQHLETKNTSRYGPFGPFVKCINNLESKYLGEKLVRHGSLESLERPKCEAIIPSKPRKKEVELSDHIQFLITEKSAPQTSSCIDASREPIDDGDVLSDGKF